MMTPERSIGGFRERFLLRRTMDAVRAAMDGLPEESKLAVWFSLCLKFTDGETARIVQMDEPRIAGVLTDCLDEMRVSLGTKGIVMDNSSLKAALAALSHEEAPAKSQQAVVSMALLGSCGIGSVAEPLATGMDPRRRIRRQAAGPSEIRSGFPRQAFPLSGLCAIKWCKSYRYYRRYYGSS